MIGHMDRQTGRWGQSHEGRGAEDRESPRQREGERESTLVVAFLSGTHLIVVAGGNRRGWQDPERQASGTTYTLTSNKLVTLT